MMQAPSGGYLLPRQGGLYTISPDAVAAPYRGGGGEGAKTYCNLDIQHKCQAKLTVFFSPPGNDYGNVVFSGQSPPQSVFSM